MGLQRRQTVRSVGTGRDHSKLAFEENSSSFDKCWPAIQKDANGVILVCNPDNQTHIREIEQWSVGTCKGKDREEKIRIIAVMCLTLATYLPYLLLLTETKALSRELHMEKT